MQIRHPSGVPFGGQFASSPLTEVGILLQSGKPDEEATPERIEVDDALDGLSPDGTVPEDLGHNDFARDETIQDGAAVVESPVDPQPVAPGLRGPDEAEWQRMLEHNETGTFEFPPPPLHWAQLDDFWTRVAIPPAVLIRVQGYLPEAREAEIRRRVAERFTEPAPQRSAYVLQKNYDKVYEVWRKKYSDVYWEMAPEVGPEKVASHLVRGLIVAEMKCRQAEFLPDPDGKERVLNTVSRMHWPDGSPMRNRDVSTFYGMRNLTDESFLDPDSRMAERLSQLYTVTQNMAVHIEQLRDEREFRAIADSSATEKEAEKRLRAAGFKEW